MSVCVGAAAPYGYGLPLQGFVYKFHQVRCTTLALMEQLAIRLIKLLANPLSHQTTVTKWLVISPQAGKSLVIPLKGKGRLPSPLQGESWRGDGFPTAISTAYAKPPTEIEAQGWSFNAGRYVGVAHGESVSDENFKENLEELNEELEVLNSEAVELQSRIAQNAASLLN